MEATKYIWINGKMILWDEAKIHILTHSLHYGGGAFEGLRVYDTKRGPAIFRLKDHTTRLFYSAKVLKMDIPYSEEELNAAQVKLVKENGLKQGYIRPIIYYGYGKMGLNPVGAPIEVVLACWPWGAYLPYDMIDVKISSYIRIHPKSTVSDAKLTGHYVNSILAVQELIGTDYHEAMLLDYKGNIAEGPGENFFIIKDGKLYTPQLGNVLKGITRGTVLEIASEAGIEVIEKDITPEEAFQADESFYTGSAAEVVPIRSIDDNVIGNGKVGPITQKLKDSFTELVNSEDHPYLTYVK